MGVVTVDHGSLLKRGVYLSGRPLAAGLVANGSGSERRPFEPPPLCGGYRMADMAKLQIGDAAPDFDLPVRGKETVRLSTALQAGPVVLLTYVLDFSPG